MPNLTDELRKSLDPQTISSLSRQIGANEEETRQAVGALVPMMIGGMSKNAQSDEGAQRLNSALEQDHDGSLLDNLSSMLGGGSSGGLGGLAGGLMGAGGGGGVGGMLGGLLGGGSRATNGAGILGHILGGHQGPVQNGVSRATGLGTGSTGQLMQLLAPIVMSALGKVKRQQNLDSRGVSNLLDRERSTLEEEAPDTQQGGLLGLLDSNRDGKVNMEDDVAKVGAALGTAFLMSRGGRR